MKNLIIFLCCVTLISCKSKAQNAIVGKWYAKTVMWVDKSVGLTPQVDSITRQANNYLQFNEDGTGSRKLTLPRAGTIIDGKFTYKVKSGTIILNDKMDSPVTIGLLTDKKLVLVNNIYNQASVIIFSIEYRR